MSHKKARIKDIAMMAGVSIGTVDRVIHNRGEVAEKTRIRVQQILQETNYSPNVMAQVLKSKKKFNLASLLPASSANNSYWEKHPAGMVRAINELDPFPVTLNQFTFDIQSEEDFQARAGELLSLNPDGVILAPIFKSESIAFCKSLQESGIPLVFIDGYLEDTDFLAYVGENIFQSGRVAAQLTDMVTPADKDILIVTIARNIQNVHHLSHRSEGFLSYFSRNSMNSGKKIIVNIPDPVKELASEILDKAIEANPNVGSIFLTGSRSYLIAEYLSKRSELSINLVGYDLLDSNVTYLKNGIIRFLIGQRPDEQTYKGIKKLFEYLSLRKIPEKFEYLPIDIVTSENVDFFL